MKSNLQKHISNINWELLREQKAVLVEMAADYTILTSDQRQAVDGILALIDGLQEAVVNDDYFTEEEVCGPECHADIPTDDFIHHSLQSDFKAGCFDGNHYETYVEKTNTGWKLNIDNIGENTNEAWEYNYETIGEADRDQGVFDIKYKIAD